MTKKVEKKKSNKLFREGFKMRLNEDMKIVDKHFQNLCDFTEEAFDKIGHDFTVATPGGYIVYQRAVPMIENFTFAYKRAGSKKGKKK